MLKKLWNYNALDGSSNIATSDSQIASWVFFLIANINTASWDKVE